jgi:predicted nucleic acid-binding protein
MPGGRWDKPKSRNVGLFIDLSLYMAHGEMRSLEWADAVHIATAFGRGDNSLLAVTDREMRQIDALQDRLI